MAQSGTQISVLVVEDDAVLRREFVEMIDAAPGIRLLDAVGSLSAARAALATRGVPDLVIVDLGLPDGDGTALIAELAVSAPDAAALVITVFGDEDHVVRAIEAGAKGYLLKDVLAEEFIRAVHMVHEGGSPLSPSVARHVLKRFVPPVHGVRPPASRNERQVEALTARETEILRLIAEGRTVVEAATALHLSPHTVTTHIKHIYGKLAVNNRVQAVNRARATGQLD